MTKMLCMHKWLKPSNFLLLPMLEILCRILSFCLNSWTNILDLSWEAYNGCWICKEGNISTHTNTQSVFSYVIKQ